MRFTIACFLSFTILLSASPVSAKEGIQCRRAGGYYFCAPNCSYCHGEYGCTDIKCTMLISKDKGKNRSPVPPRK